MPNTLAQKLRIRENFILRTIHAPAEFEAELQPLPIGVTISPKTKTFNQLHWFVENRAQLEKELDTAINLVNGDIVCWIYYPKGSSKMQTDLTRDKGWDALLSHKELQWLSLISFNDTWSAFGFREKKDSDRKKDTAPKEREIFKYADSATKKIILPGDLAEAFKGNKDAGDAFEQLSFSHKREYVDWIITAKRPQTRTQRITGTIEKLLHGWKNPRNMT